MTSPAAATSKRVDTADFDYELPPERIAQTPLSRRDTSRLLHVARDGALSDHRFTELPRLLRQGDLLVVNDTRVRRARLRGVTDAGVSVEVLVISRSDDGRYTCLVRPSRRIRPGANVRFTDELVALCED
ncbi:MAG: S-adenosylmethionine:tRNA ribosyltransferase-isomerase, partial [Candidatus Dormibacteria bacterium]